MSINIIKDILIQYWPLFFRGALITLLISITGTIIGFSIGLLIGILKTSPTPKNKLNAMFKKIVNIILSIYIEVFRGTPMIVQAMVIYYGSAIAFNINIDKMIAAFIIVSINTGAYMAEIVRGGIDSVDDGQYEAAISLGMKHKDTMISIILPQAIRNILPSIGNEFIINIKDTSVLNVISVTELFFQTKSVAGTTFNYFEAFFITSIIYLIMTFTITSILRYIEKRIDKPKDCLMNKEILAESF